MNTKSRLLINSLLFISAIIMVSLACNLPGEETATLKLEPSAADGSVGYYEGDDYFSFDAHRE